MESVILAAGYASRFNFKDDSFKKYMLPFERSNILNYIIIAMKFAGIDKINLIVNAKTKKEEINNYCKNFFEKVNVPFDSVKLNFIQNNDIERENGYSLYLGSKEVKSEYFIVSMADHVFSDNIYSILINKYDIEDIILATDPMDIEGCYDLDDCTKVFGENLKIKQIGKLIPHYNRLDMGVFMMKAKTIQKIANNIEKKQKKFGVSDIVIEAIKSNMNVKYLDFPNTVWLDVDTDTEYAKLNKIFCTSSKFSPFNLNINIA